MKQQRTVGKFTALVAVAILAAGCSGNSGGEEVSLGNDLLKEAADKLTGEPITIVDISEITGVPGLPAINLPNGARAAAAYVNENGGIGGRPIEIVSCDSKFDPGASRACAQDAVAQNALAVIGLDDYSATAGDALLEKNDIITMNAPNQTSLIQSSNSFALGPAGAGELNAIGHYLGAMKQLENISLLMQDVPPAHSLAELLESAARNAGVDEVNTVYFPIQTTDFSAPVAKVVSSDPEAVFTLATGSQLSIIWNLLQQQGINSDQVYVQGGSLDASFFKEAGSVAVDANVMSEFTNPDDLSDPDVKLYREAMDKYGFGDIARSMFSQWGFANVMFLAEVAKTIGPQDLDAKVLKEYLTTTLGPGSDKTIPTFMGPDMSAAAPSHPGIHRPGVSILKWDGEKFVTVQDFFTAPQLLPAQS